MPRKNCSTELQLMMCSVLALNTPSTAADRPGLAAHVQLEGGVRRLAPPSDAHPLLQPGEIFGGIGRLPGEPGEMAGEVHGMLPGAAADLEDVAAAGECRGDDRKDRILVALAGFRQCHSTWACGQGRGRFRVEKSATIPARLGSMPALGVRLERSALSAWRPAPVPPAATHGRIVPLDRGVIRSNASHRCPVGQTIRAAAAGPGPRCPPLWPCCSRARCARRITAGCGPGGSFYPGSGARCAR